MPYKDCEDKKRWGRGYYIKNREKKIRQVNEYYYKNHEKRKAQKKKWAQNNKEKLIEYRKNYFPIYKKRKKLEESARGKLNRAVANGKIVRPDLCSRCDKKGLIHGHHENYSKPYEVIWLCHQCHFTEHRKCLI